MLVINIYCLNLFSTQVVLFENMRLKITDACSIEQFPSTHRDMVRSVSYLVGVDPQHALFLVVCKILSPDINIETISKMAPHGGKIGIGDSYLNSLLKYSKVLRLHAGFHDAFGFMKSNFNIGPGYCYMVHWLPNNCLLGHITGILYCLRMKLFANNDFETIIV